MQNGKKNCQHKMSQRVRGKKVEREREKRNEGGREGRRKGVSKGMETLTRPRKREGGRCVGVTY